MARQGWTERNRWTVSNTNIEAVFGHTDMTTNSSHQYTLDLQQWDGDCLIEVSVPVRFSWRPEDESLKPEGQGWDGKALLKYWDSHLHQGRTIAVRTKAGLIRRKGDKPVAPSVNARRQKMAEAEAARQAAEKQRHDAACAQLALAAAEARNNFFEAVARAKWISTLSGWKEILKVEGIGPESLVTIQGENAPIEAKWLEGGGVKSLRFE